jgi:hypothetical protein
VVNITYNPLKNESMKNTFTSSTTCLVIAALLGLSSCKNQDPEPAVFKAPTASNRTVASGAAITFTDNATGVSKREWVFPGGTPATSSDKTVAVKFFDGPAQAYLSVTLSDGTKKATTLNVQVGNELFSRAYFGFESDSSLVPGRGWKQWNPSLPNRNVTLTRETTGGANGTPGCLKVVISTTLTEEAQLFTKENVIPINATLEPNKNYTFSFWIKATDAIVAALNLGDGDPNLKYLNAALENSNDKAIGDFNGLPLQSWKGYVWANSKPSPVNTWTKVTVDFNTGDAYSGANSANTYGFFKFNSGLPAGTVYIDEVSILPK